MTIVHSTKERAISLRKKGLSYSEILEQVPVAKSTLSLWLRSVGLSKRQKQRITEKKLAAAHKGGAAKKQQRIERSNRIQEDAKKEISHISKRELWLLGIALYWAEGSKEKEEHPGLGVQFTNGDPAMIKLFLKWLVEICDIPRDRIYFDIFIHENSKNNIEKVKKYWSTATGFSETYFPHIYFKKHSIKTNRKNIGDTYYGLLKVMVKASSNLQRKIAGWVKGVIEYDKQI